MVFNNALIPTTWCWLHEPICAIFLYLKEVFKSFTPKVIFSLQLVLVPYSGWDGCEIELLIALPCHVR